MDRFLFLAINDIPYKAIDAAQQQQLQADKFYIQTLSQALTYEALALFFTCTHVISENLFLKIYPVVWDITTAIKVKIFCSRKQNAYC